MPKRNVERLFKTVRTVADRLAEDEARLTGIQLENELRQSGVDPERLRHRLHEALKAVAKRERLSGRRVPTAVRQAIETFSPDDIMPFSEQEAESKMERWLDTFLGSHKFPRDLVTGRAYRKASEVSDDDEADLNELEEQLMDEISSRDDSEG